MKRHTARVLVVAALLVAPGFSRAADSWTKALAKRGIDPSLFEDPIGITPEIKTAADSIAGPGGGTVDQLNRLQSGLFDSARFAFTYDAGATETAAEALASGRGDCVAFTNLFIAMARSQGLRVQGGYIEPHASGEKRGDLIYVSTHVVAVYPIHGRIIVFDFYKTREDRSRRIRLLDDLELTALYVNNRGVVALSAGDYARAEALFTAASKLAPKFAAAEGNLGVLLRRRGDIPGALDAYRRALALAPHDPSILGNLAALYSGLGRDREATAALRLADLSVATPYTILARGDLEAADGRIDDAFRFYRRAARLAPKLPDAHVSIARLARATGRRDEARREAKRALELDPENTEAREIHDGCSDAEGR
jgi:tetratricopeptide (TPR) repeat protein